MNNKNTTLILSLILATLLFTACPMNPLKYVRITLSNDAVNFEIPESGKTNEDIRVSFGFNINPEEFEQATVELYTTRLDGEYPDLTSDYSFQSDETELWEKGSFGILRRSFSKDFLSKGSFEFSYSFPYAGEYEILVFVQAYRADDSYMQSKQYFNISITMNDNAAGLTIRDETIKTNEPLDVVLNLLLDSEIYEKSLVKISANRMDGSTKNEFTGFSLGGADADLWKKTSNYIERDLSTEELKKGLSDFSFIFPEKGIYEITLFTQVYGKHESTQSYTDGTLQKSYYVSVVDYNN